MLHNLSQKKVNEKDLRDVALKGLGLEGQDVQRHISNSKDITEAAYNVLRDWFNTQNSPNVAYTMLTRALEIANKRLMIVALS